MLSFLLPLLQEPLSTKPGDVKTKNEGVHEVFMVVLYVVLLLLRLLLVSSPGYIHPDEFFQSPEIVAPGGVIPWEFSSEHALRSPVYPYVVSWLPKQLLPTSWWWSPRLFMFVSSLSLDLFVWHSSNGSWHALLLLASSWPAFVLSTRTFSNGLEAVAVALFALFLSRARFWQASIVAACGVFARFTFPLFAFPFLFASFSFRRRFLVLLVLPALFVSLLFVFFDSLYFGRFVISPLNAFLYNVQTENVALHGLHPRYLHALVNFPLLLGPILLFRLRLRLVWILPLLLISASPHQEPRFLLPLVAPAIVSSSSLNNPSRMEWGLHLSYHVLAGAFFSHFHQAGVVKSLRHLEEIHSGRSNRPSVIYWKTYAPPAHLAPHVDVVDGMGMTLTEAINNASIVVMPKYLAPASLKPTMCWWPHVSTENPPPSLFEAQLCEFPTK